VDEAVHATLRAVEAHVGEVYNVGGGETACVWDILRQLEDIVSRAAIVRLQPVRPGDKPTTHADTSKLRRHLG